MAGVPAPVRYRAHLPAVQADPRLDRPQTTHTAGGRSVDLAGPDRLHPTPTGPWVDRGSAASVGETGVTGSVVPSAGPTRVSEPTPATGLSSGCSETLPARSGTTDWRP